MKKSNKKTGEKLLCPCGKKSKKEAPSSVSVGGMRDETGFFPVFTDEGRVIWLCEDCSKSVKEYAKKIHEIIKDDYIYFAGLLKE